MIYKSIAISSGHGLYVRGASSDMLDEVDEARKVVDRLVLDLADRGVDVVAFHDNSSTSQSENLDAIVDWHNRQNRELDISVHFNAYEQVEKPMGTEVLYLTQPELAADLAGTIAGAGVLTNRGAKKRTDLAFLNGTEEPAVLLEICFCDSETDCEQYYRNFRAICSALADTLAGTESGNRPDRPEPVPPDEEQVLWSGKVSHFGGPDDEGVSPSEGLAFIYELDKDNQHLFLPLQPSGTTGLARRLNPYVHYIACRWDYDDHPKDTLLDKRALVRAHKTGISLLAIPADWGPHGDTNRVADLSPSLMLDLGITTDDKVDVIFPYDNSED